MGSRTLSLALYNTLLPPVLLLMAPAALVKMRRREGRWQDLAQRLGFLSAERAHAVASLPRQELIWMHAVSVGEVGVAQKLIHELLRKAPDQGIALTSTTPTGHRLALEIEAAHPGRVVALHSPIDLPFVARRMLKELQPAQIVLVEAEVWPNVVSQATDAGIPVTLVNARLSPRSEARFRRFRGLTGPVFRMLRSICVQEESDVARWQGLGALPEQVTFTGSVKYDPRGSAAAPEKVAETASLLASAGLARRPIILAASTHAGEERAFGEIYARLHRDRPGLGLLVVPRHYERGVEVRDELASIGLVPLLRSQMAGADPGADVIVIDSTGELKAWLEHASIVIVGKSFLAHGGQNPAEAVMAGKPVIMGPHMENFRSLVSLLLAAGGAIQVSDLQGLELALVALLDSPVRQESIATAGRVALNRHNGATERTADKILNVRKQD